MGLIKTRCRATSRVGFGQMIMAWFATSEAVAEGVTTS
jgi:hypothetical protein